MSTTATESSNVDSVVILQHSPTSMPMVAQDGELERINQVKPSTCILTKKTFNMKRTIIIIALLLAIGTASAQQVTRQGNTFTQVEKKAASKGTKTKYTWKDSKGNEYPIYVAKSGSCYVIRTSKKSGNEYRQYLGKEISSEVCKELGIEYKPTSKK